jgi:hypothetical protein
MNRNATPRALAAATLLLAACSRPTFTADHDGQTVEVEKGQRFRIELAASNRSLEPRYRFTRHPNVAGDAVTLVEREEEPPPAGQDGAAGRERFLFEAARRGKATITFARVYPEERSITGLARREIEFTLHVAVE